MNIQLRGGGDKGKGGVYGVGKWCNEVFPVYAGDGEHVIHGWMWRGSIWDQVLWGSFDRIRQN